MEYNSVQICWGAKWSDEFDTKVNEFILSHVRRHGYQPDEYALDSGASASIVAIRHKITNIIPCRPVNLIGLQGQLVFDPDFGKVYV